LIALALSKIRDIYVYPRLEDIIDEKFPQVSISTTNRTKKQRHINTESGGTLARIPSKMGPLKGP